MGHGRRVGALTHPSLDPTEREFFIDNLLVRIHFIIQMIWWTGLAPWKFESPFSGSLTSSFLAGALKHPDSLDRRERDRLGAGLPAPPGQP